MEILNPEYFDVFKSECNKMEFFLQDFGYRKSDKFNYHESSYLIKHSLEYIHKDKKLIIDFSYAEFLPIEHRNFEDYYSINFYIHNNINYEKTFYFSKYLKDTNQDKVVKRSIEPNVDFNQTIRDFFQHARRLLANELKDTLLGNEVHDHAERVMQSYVDHIYDSPTLAQNLYQEQIDDYRKKMSLYDRFIEWNSRLIVNLEIQFFRFVTPILRFLNSLFDDKK